MHSAKGTVLSNAMGAREKLTVSTQMLGISYVQMSEGVPRGWSAQELNET